MQSVLLPTIYLVLKVLSIMAIHMKQPSEGSEDQHCPPEQMQRVQILSNLDNFKICASGAEKKDPGGGRGSRGADQCIESKLVHAWVVQAGKHRCDISCSISKQILGSYK